MIRVLLCCGGGFSSSYIVEKMKKEIINKNISDKILIEYSPFSLSIEKIHDCDIMICCPHLNVYIKSFVESNDINIPIYVLPPRMYGKMEIEEIYLDYMDIIDIYNQTNINPVHFPGEENVLKIKRSKAYKKSV